MPSFTFRKNKSHKWKYELLTPYFYQTEIFPKRTIIYPFFTFYATGLLVLNEGYKCDGATGVPAWIQDRFLQRGMRGFFIHDCLCQILNDGHLEPHFRVKADLEMHKCHKQDGLNNAVADGIFAAVRIYGEIKS